MQYAYSTVVAAKPRNPSMLIYAYALLFFQGCGCQQLLCFGVETENFGSALQSLRISTVWFRIQGPAPRVQCFVGLDH